MEKRKNQTLSSFRKKKEKTKTKPHHKVTRQGGMPRKGAVGSIRHLPNKSPKGTRGGGGTVVMKCLSQGGRRVKKEEKLPLNEGLKGPKEDENQEKKVLTQPISEKKSSKKE